MITGQLNHPLLVQTLIQFLYTGDESVKPPFISFQTIIQFLYTGDESVITGQLNHHLLVFRP